MMNLFLLVTLQQYDEFQGKDGNPIEKFNNIVNAFKNSWNMFSNESDEGYRIKNNQLPRFLEKMNTDFTNKLTELDLRKKYIMDLNLLKYVLLF